MGTKAALLIAIILAVLLLAGNIQMWGWLLLPLLGVTSWLFPVPEKSQDLDWGDEVT